MSAREFAVIGAGIGGMAAAIALDSVGARVRIFEQATQFRRIGAAIYLTPNAVRVLDKLGVGGRLRETAFSPDFRVSRDYSDGRETSRIEMGGAAERKYGAPLLVTHRADLLEALEKGLPDGSISLGHRLVSVVQARDKVVLNFANGAQTTADAVIGADGVHSTVRKNHFDEEAPTYSGMAAYRAIFPTDRLQGYDTRNFIKWWGPKPSSQMVTFAISRGREMFVFATKEEPEPARESWSAECDVNDLRTAFKDYHSEAQAALTACEVPLKTALYTRAPLGSWVNSRIALLGDAAHPMLPFMAQGAAMALEDAAVLARCVDHSSDVTEALQCYAATRMERANLIQRVSSENEWLRTATNAEWVYGFDAWSTALLMQTPDAEKTSSSISA